MSPAGTPPPPSPSPSGAPAPSGLVLWTFRARRVLRRCLPDPDADPKPYQDHLGRVLRDTFPNRSIVVQDVMTGFRPRSDWFILLVEVMAADGAPMGANVVKVVGPPSSRDDRRPPSDELRRELANWQRCAPPGLRQDVVFLPLERGSPQDDSQPPESILYGDAHQFIGVAIALALEDVVSRAVRFGFPLVGSVLDVLAQLFERAGYRFYYAGREDGPRDPSAADGRDAPPYQFDIPRLGDALELWASDPDLVGVRLEVDNLIVRIERRHGGQDERLYLGPAPYLAEVGKLVPWVDPGLDRRRAPTPAPAPPPPAEPPRERPPAAGPAPREPSLTEARPADVVPGMLRGPAHGDLHGRNVLVGVVRDRACWPAVFDYGDMGPRNFVGWDFVKLETELKVRLYEKVFGTPNEGEFAKEVQRFEVELARQTEKHRHDNDWPAGVVAGDADRGRLRAVVLRVREMAAVHLGENPGRPHRWLEEYYFLLMCYGVTAGRFSNYTRRQRIAVLVSAGTAAARLSWPRRRFEEEMRVVNAAAPAGGTPPGPLAVAEEVLDRLRQQSVGYDAPLDLASRWRRSGDPDLAARAADWLTGLKERFRYSLDVRHELVLALLTAGRQTEAIRELRDAQALLRNPNEEILCRWGRVFKDDGDQLRAADAKAADERYHLSAAQYEEAYAIRKGHYPGINLATVLLVRAGLAQRLVPPQDAQALLGQLDRTVKELLDRCSKWPDDYGDQDRRVWHPATQAEARLLQREWDRAEKLYRSIPADSRTRQSRKDSSGRRWPPTRCRACQLAFHCTRYSVPA